MDVLRVRLDRKRDALADEIHDIFQPRSHAAAFDVLPVTLSYDEHRAEYRSALGRDRRESTRRTCKSLDLSADLVASCHFVMLQQPTDVYDSLTLPR